MCFEVGILVMAALFLVGCGRDVSEPCNSMVLESGLTYEQVYKSTDIPRLEAIADSFCHVTNERVDVHLRFVAYARLGEIGTAESLAAVERIDERGKQIKPISKRLSLGYWPSPVWHISGIEVELFTTTETDQGITYGLLLTPVLGALDISLVSSRDPSDRARWTRPIPVRNVLKWGIENPELAAQSAGHLRFSFDETEPEYFAMPREELLSIMGMADSDLEAIARRLETGKSGQQHWEVDLNKITHDSDGDGWTDTEETRLGLNPNNSDSDDDGINDGDDITPDYKNPAMESLSENQKILQKAIFATLGLSGSRCLVIVDGPSERVPIWGYAGPILYDIDGDEWRKQYGFVVVGVNWEIVSRTQLEAEVAIRDYRAPFASGYQRVFLRRIQEEWYVVAWERGLVS
ncbi:MAG: hypothetical protein GY835_00045 [bacterium]|nr:hypothetical protein [bacterium]